MSVRFNDSLQNFFFVSIHTSRRDWAKYCNWRRIQLAVGRSSSSSIDVFFKWQKEQFLFKFVVNKFTLLSFVKSPTLESSSFDMTIFDDDDGSGAMLSLFASFDSKEKNMLILKNNRYKIESIHFFIPYALSEWFCFSLNFYTQKILFYCH